MSRPGPAAERGSGHPSTTPPSTRSSRPASHAPPSSPLAAPPPPSRPVALHVVPVDDGGHRPDRPRRPAVDAGHGARRESGARWPGRPARHAAGPAHRLAPEAVFLDPDPAADAAAIEAALERLAAFSPGIAGDDGPDRPRLRAARGPGSTGSSGCGAPSPMLVGRVREALAADPARQAPGGHRRDAVRGHGRRRRRRARPCSRSVAAGRRGRSSSRHSPRPCSRRDPEVRARLARFGLSRIGQVAELPAVGARRPVRRRRASGCTPGPGARRPSRSGRGGRPERLSLALPVEPAVDDLEPLRFLLHRLAAALADQLLARGMATATVHLRLALDVAFAPRGHVAPDIDHRAAPARAHRRGRGHRAPARRPARADAAARAGRPAGARARRGRARRPASSCRCSCPRRPVRPGSAGSSPGSR